MLAGSIFVGGCCGALQGPAELFLLGVGTEYKAYVEDDGDLDDRERRIRLQHVQSFEKAVDACGSSGGE